MLFKTSALLITVYSPGSGSTSQCTLRSTPQCTLYHCVLTRLWIYIPVHSIPVYPLGSGSTSQYTLYHCVFIRQWIYIPVHSSIYTTVHSLSLCTHQAVVYIPVHSIPVYPLGSGSTSQCTLSLCTHWAVDLHHSALYPCVPTGQWIYITVHSIPVYPLGSGSTSQCTLSLCTHWAVDLHHSALYPCVPTGQWIYITVHSLSLCTHQAVDLHPSALFDLHHSALFITVYSPNSGRTLQFTLYHCVLTGQWICITVHSLSPCLYSPCNGFVLQFTLYTCALTGHRLVRVKVPDLHQEGVHTQVLSVGDELGHHHTGVGCLAHCDTHHSLTCAACTLLIYTHTLMHTHA